MSGVWYLVMCYGLVEVYGLMLEGGWGRSGVSNV